MAPYFDLHHKEGQGYEAQRRRYYNTAVEAGFGAPPDTFRAVTQTRVLSWHTSALGLTLDKQRDVIPRAARGLLLPVGAPARNVAAQARSWARGVDWLPEGEERPPPPRPPASLWLIERTPDDLFIRILERLRYPLAAVQAALTMWDTLQQRLHDVAAWERQLRERVWAAGERFLGDAQTRVKLMRDRLRAGGLLPGDREMLNVLALGVVGEYPPPPAWLRDLLVLLDWLAERFRRPKPPSEDPEPPGELGLGGMRLRSRFHLLGLELETHLGDRMVARSTMGVGGAPDFHFWPGTLPPGLTPLETLHEHRDHWRLSHSRRQVLYRLGGGVLSLIIKYLTMGPVGLIVSVLHMLAEGLLDVVSYGRRLMWPVDLPDPADLAEGATVS